MWNNGALEGACGSRYSTLKQSVLKFLPAVEQGEKRNGSMVLKKSME